MNFRDHTRNRPPDCDERQEARCQWQPALDRRRAAPTKKPPEGGFFVAVAARQCTPCISFFITGVSSSMTTPAPAGMTVKIRKKVDIEYVSEM